MTVITVSTVGFREVRQLSDGGRVMTMAIIIMGVSMVAYAGSGLMGELVENRIRRVLGRRRVERKISRLKQHVIVCGYGRMGRMLAQELVGLGQSFVVVENQAQRTSMAEESGHTYVLGDARQESVLEMAGIHQARALVAALASDADNLLMTLTAKGMAETRWWSPAVRARRRRRTSGAPGPAA
jgi:voltage-gated potassium channel